MQQAEKLGVYWVPGTFPTGIMKDALNEFDPLGPDWSRDSINSLYFHYKSGVEEGKISALDRDDPNSVPAVIAYIDEVSRVDPMLIEQFLLVLDYLVQDQVISPLYIEIERPSSDPVAKGKKAADEAGEKVLQIANVVKWVAVAGIVGVVVFYGGPLISRQIKKRGKKNG